MTGASPRRARVRRTAPLLAAVTLALAAAGCRGMTSSKPPVHPNPSMDDQPKVKAQQESRFFYNGSAMRPPVPGTIALGELREDAAFYEGKNADGSFVAKVPVEAGEQVLERGKNRYTIYCQPCHDARGDGHGILFQRGNIPTASFHQDKIRNYPDGQIFDVITNGSGLMPSYRWPLAPADRWAIIAYVRTLQQKRGSTGG
jgi:mono/diheme cytochrome c family protein